MTCLSNYGIYASPSGQLPLIIMGGRWITDPDSQYSHLKQICDIGFTHVSSYYTESQIDTNITLDLMVERASEFAASVKKTCPSLSLVIGLPRKWIYKDQSRLIQKYISRIGQMDIEVDFWYSDEMILQMVRKGVRIDQASDKLSRTASLLSKHSGVPYIVIEAGNYNNQTLWILRKLSEIDQIPIKSFNEYPVSKYGRLTRSGLKSIIKSLNIIKKESNIVFPVCGIHEIDGKTVSRNELATILLSLLMNGANGFFFYEDRRTTPQILQYLTELNPLISKIHRMGILNFVFKESELLLCWQNQLNSKRINIWINTGNQKVSIPLQTPERQFILWPQKMAVLKREFELNPLSTLIVETNL